MVPIIVGTEGVFEGPSEVFWYSTKFPENQPSTSRKKAFVFKGARLRTPSSFSTHRRCFRSRFLRDGDQVSSPCHILLSASTPARFQGSHLCVRRPLLRWAPYWNRPHDVGLLCILKLVPKYEHMSLSSTDTCMQVEVDRRENRGEQPSASSDEGPAGRLHGDDKVAGWSEGPAAGMRGEMWPPR